MPIPAPDATQILAELREGDRSAAARLMPLVYDQLRAIAESYFREQPAAQTLQPTALVHEAYLRMVNQTRAGFQDRSHFLAVCAVAMRGILADHARRRLAAKRGGDWNRITLASVETPSPADEIDVLALDEALKQLEVLDARAARIVELRWFAGVAPEEIARMLQITRRTVDRDWRFASAFLHSALK